MSYKKIEFADIFDKIKINLNEEKKKNNVKIAKVAESNDYIIYKYEPEDIFSRTYIIGQSKINSKKVYLFGCNFDHACVYKENLFMCNHKGEVNTPSAFVHKLNLKTKIIRTYNFRADYGEWVYFNGFGRRQSCDDYRKMKIVKNNLIISCHRNKCFDNDGIEDPFNKEMDFEILFKFIDNEFVPYFLIDDTEYKLISDNYITDEEIARKQKSNKNLEKLDNAIPFIAMLMILFIIVGLISCIITKFSNIVWNIIFIIGIVGMIISCILNKVIGNLKSNNGK